MNNFFRERLKQIEAVIIPTKPLQWQTFLLVALLLWLGSISLSLGNDSNNKMSEILGSLSWLFLTISVSFLSAKKLAIGNFTLSPWITGAMLCFFLYQNVNNDVQSFIVIMWPLLSLCIAELTVFFKNGGKLESSPPLTSKSFTFMFLINLLLTCWLSLHFVIQEWSKQYPSLLEEDVSNSAFITKIKPTAIVESRGATILNLIEQKLRAETGDRQLETSVEKMKLKLITLKHQALEQLPPAKENKFWFLQTPIIASNSGYQIELQLIWQGPTPGKDAYYLSKSCQIQRQVSTPESGETPNEADTSQELPQIVNIVECGSVRRKALNRPSV